MIWDYVIIFLQQRISLYGEFTVSQLEISRTLLNSGLLTIDTFILPLLKFLLYHNTFTLVIWSLYFIHLLTHLVHAKLLIWIIKRMKVSHCPQHCNVTSFNVLEIAVFPTRAITTFSSSCVHLNKLLFTFYRYNHLPLLDRLTCIVDARRLVHCYGRNFSYFYYIHISHFHLVRPYTEIDITRNHCELCKCYDI